MSTATTHGDRSANVRLPRRLNEVPIRPVSVGRLVTVELRKATDTRAGRWLLAIIGLLVLAAATMLIFIGEPGEEKSFSDFFGIAFLPINLLLPIVGILVVTTEWSQRTALTTFSLEPKRLRVGMAKWLAALILGFGVILVAAAIAALATAAAPMLRGGEASWEMTWQLALGTALFQFVTMSMGVAFGLLLQNTPAAIVSYLVLPQLWTALGEISWLRTAGEWVDTNRTLTPLMEGRIHGDQWAQLVTSILVWVILPMILGMIRLRRSEVK